MVPKAPVLAKLRTTMVPLLGPHYPLNVKMQVTVDTIDSPESSTLLLPQTLVRNLAWPGALSG